MLLPTIAGWIGMVLIVGAYYLISTKKVSGTSILYQLMNLGGGARYHMEYLRQPRLASSGLKRRLGNYRPLYISEGEKTGLLKIASKKPVPRLAFTFSNSKQVSQNTTHCP